MHIANLRRLDKLTGPFLITGHAGLKGSWLTFLLEKLGVPSIVYSLPPERDLLFSQIHNSKDLSGKCGDIRNLQALQTFLTNTTLSDDTSNGTTIGFKIIQNAE